MTTHELATKLLETASKLFAKNDTDTPLDKVEIQISYYDKEAFLDIVRTLGAGKKEFGYEFTYKPTGTVLSLVIARNKVCSKIQEEKWECTPLLTPDEFVVSG